jgi:hypothetical protein
MGVARSAHTATLLPVGQVLVAGGQIVTVSASTILAAAELYDPTAATWTAAPSMNNARFDHTDTMLLTGNVLVTGGRSGTAKAATSSAEIYTLTKDDCKKEEWKNFTLPPGPFKNQGQCVSFMVNQGVSN